MDQIRLEKLTRDTVDDVLKLRVSKEQKSFVAKNSDSIIDAYFAMTEDKKSVYIFGIYNGKKPVGFLMISYNCDWRENLDFAKNSYYIWRFMIDRRYQGNGYGRAALKLAIDFVRTAPCGKAEYCWLSYEPENEIARKLYLSMGFEEKLELCKEDEEIPAVLKL
ncbi:MAG: GNAT family N-acetyltransferase [Clostridia bacterium]|nr:GNAT family N-acetyltransferase [Clostridia bacterium]